VIDKLGAFEPPVPVWCLYSEDDQPSYDVCNSIKAKNFSGVLYASGAVEGFPHGMNLIQPNVSPNPLNLILEFLGDVVG
jgi:hypothetical protein